MRFISFALALFIAASSFAAEDPVSFRVRFGMKDTEGQDWSGKVVLSNGSVESIRGWRWTAGDKADGPAWTVATRRPQAQSRAEQQRVRSGQQLPVQDNGLIITMIGLKPESTLNFEFAPGKTEFKLSDIVYGKPHIALDGNLQIERIPTAAELAGTTADEDYPAAVRAKDGTLYVAYLSFTHGKDFQGARERPATPESGPNTGPLQTGQVRKIEKPQDLDYLAQPTGGEQIFLRVRSPDGTWGEPIAVTDGKHELYRPAIAIDAAGKVWVFYSAHLDADENLDHGNWELLARSFDAKGANGGDAINVSNAPGSDFMPAAATDSDGKAWVTWVGGRERNFHVFAAGQDGDKFSPPQRVSQSAGNEWEPAIAADAKGHLTVAWDTYAKGDYDVYLAQRGTDGKFAKPQAVAATLAFEVRPSLTYDGQGQLWIAWEESGDHWGKDFGALKKEGIALYNTGRSIATKVLREDGSWQSPADVMEAMPPGGPPSARQQRLNPASQPAWARGSIAPCFPRLSSDLAGNVWLAFRGKPGSNWRVPVGSVWFEYVTRLDGDAWNEAVWIPRSSNILDNRPAVVGEDNRLTLFYSGDGRGELNAPKVGDPHLAGAAEGTDDDAAPAASGSAADNAPSGGAQPRARGGRRQSRGEINADLFVTSVDAKDFGSAERKPFKLTPAEPASVVASDIDATEERAAVQAIRDFRINLNGENLRIWRGEFHRHTELSPDGGNDGGLLDMWRYGIDAANLDWIGDGDHDYGSGREYSWWTTQKAVTIFTLKNQFVPIFSYERSVSYPEGHRNCMFAKRGIRSLPRLPISDPDVEKPAPDTNLLYMYLHHFDGLCASHTSATDMGTDWRNNDPVVEPFVEIYQGDRNNYERPDSPRSAVTEAKRKQSTPEKESLGGWRPKGFVNLALARGYRLAFQSSSDHISTHLSYCNVLIPADKEPTRQAILDAVKKRRVYGATDNIVADVRCKVGDTEHLMGEEFTTTEAPTLNVHLIGALAIAKVTIIKDDEEVHVVNPNAKDVNFTWTDPKPSEPGKISYYYVRGEQAPDMEGISSGELVWASPMWIKYEPQK